MARIPIGKLRALPWAVLLDAGVVLGRRWNALSGRERKRLGELLLATRGQMANLSVRERAELRRLVKKLDLAAAGRELVPFANRLRGKR
ncbi:MAG: hypothetical protein E6G56_05620 [Actinobacteria bacterium]|nr:MAG: hypothetical protein E6G56_05620 [Actinomycetota bacterium]